MMAGHQKVCERCGAEFVAGRSDTRFCSKRCSRLARDAANHEEVRKRERAYYAANAEKKRGQARARRAANPERARERNRSWAAANADKKRRMDRAYCAANAERAVERVRAWRAANPDKRAESERVRRRSKGQSEAALHVLNVMTKLKTEGDT